MPAASLSQRLCCTGVCLTASLISVEALNASVASAMAPGGAFDSQAFQPLATGGRTFPADMLAACKQRLMLHYLVRAYPQM